MKTITLKHPYPVNAARLHEDLSAAVGEAFIGLRLHDGVVQVRLNVEPSDTLTAAVRDTLITHDPRQTSRAEAERLAHAETLAALREVDSPLLLADFANESAAVQVLARKMLLLEAALKTRG